MYIAAIYRLYTKITIADKNFETGQHYIFFVRTKIGQILKVFRFEWCGGVTYGGYPCKGFAAPATIGPGSRANAAAAAAAAEAAAAADVGKAGRARPL